MGLNTLVAFAAGIVAISGAYAALDRYDLRPAWKPEVVELAADVYSDQLRRAEARLWDVRLQIEKRRKEGLPIPPELVEAFQHWQRQVDSLKRKVKR